MITYRIETENIKMRGSPNRTLILELSAKDFEDCATIVTFLSEAMLEYFSQEKPDVDCMYPVFIEIDKSLMISELTLWKIILENSEIGLQLIIEYLNKTMNQAILCDGKLCFNDPQHFVFSYPLIASLDELFENISLQEKKTWDYFGKSLIEIFYSYLQICDLSFETFQDDYITKVIDYCCLFDKSLAAKYLGFRLTNGQFTEKNYEYLNKILEFRLKKDSLKMVIEYILKNDIDKIKLSRSTYEPLCGSIYGNSNELIQDVISYIEKKVGVHLDEKAGKIYQMNLQRIKDTSDIYRRSSRINKGVFDTGFHIYNYETKEWLVSSHV